MKHFFTLLTLFILGFSSAFAQTDCSSGRYSTYDLFSEVNIIEDVLFGSNEAVTGGTQELKMDIYEPANDTQTDRPVVVVAFGGSFVSGDRSQVAFLCNILAKMGYVAVAPDYRVGFFVPNQVTTTLAVLRGAHDVSACVRYLKKTASEDGNPYGIDCEKIIVGGISAGAISAIHSAYFDKISEIPEYMQDDTAGLGGVAGNSGTPNYPHDAIGVISFSGAIGDTSWIESGDPAIMSIHEENDEVVPYYTEEVEVLGISTGLIASGSGDLHIRATNVGINETLLPYLGVNNHVGYFMEPIDQNALDFTRDFLADLVCNSGSTNSCEAFTTNITEPSIMNLAVYPNPTSNLLKFRTDEVGTVEVIDATGRIIMNASTTLGLNRLDLTELPKGAYLLKFNGNSLSTARFIKE